MTEGHVPADGDWRRLYPWSWVLTAIGPGSLVVVGIAITTLAGSDPGAITGRLIALFAVVAVGMAVSYVNQQYYRYRIANGELVVRHGILRREERRIPLGRIHELDVSQGPLQRYLGVGVLRVQTAGGSEPEAVMRVVALSEVERLRRQVGLEGATEEHGAQPQSEEAVLLRMPAPELVRLGLVRNQAWGVVAAVAVLLSQTGVFDLLDFGGLLEEALPAIGETDPSQAIATLAAMTADTLEVAPLIAFVASALAILVGLAITLSILLSFLRFHGFELTAPVAAPGPTRLRARFGLLVRIGQATPTSRIQRLRVMDGLRCRLMSRRMIRMDTAGGEDGGGSNEGLTAVISGGSRHWLAPLAPAGEVAGLLRRAMPESPAAEDALWRPIDPRARTRRFRVRTVLFLAALAVGWLVTSWALALTVPVLGLLYWQAHQYTASRAWAAESDALLWRRGWWRRELTLIPYSRIQSAKVRQSPLDRHHGMASVHVDVAGTPGIGARIPYLKASTASGLAARLNREASRRAFDWD